MIKLPRLLMPLSEAKALLEHQIRRGESIENPSMSDEAIAEALGKMDVWAAETEELLLTMFDSPEFAERFKQSGTYEDRRGNLRDNLMTLGRITYKNYCLSDIIKELPNYEQKVEVEEAADFWSLIHPEIIAVTKTRFETGHYADCAEAAFKHNTCVKEIVYRNTGKELDGAPLMRHAFSPNNPVITIETLATESGRNVQQGFMDIFAGSMTGIRNPKAHGIINIGPERATHFIFLASLLMDTIDIANHKFRF